MFFSFEFVMIAAKNTFLPQDRITLFTICEQYMYTPDNWDWLISESMISLSHSFDRMTCPPWMCTPRIAWLYNHKANCTILSMI